MKAAVLEQLHRIVVQNVPDPVVGDNKALMQVAATSICGSDVRIFRHGNPRVKTPTIIGHETAGTIVQVGRRVTRVNVGDRVAIGADVPCGRCSWCRNGMGNNCSINFAMGYQFQGAFPEYLKLPQLCLEQGPITTFDSTKLSFAEAALAEPLACAINGCELVNVSLGKRVVIIGLGPIGCMMIDLTRAMGATTVIGVQRGGQRMEIAKTYAADAYVNSGEEDVVSRCRELTGGEGPDIVITSCASVEAHSRPLKWWLTEAT